jgi:S-adenosylmethionine/arginine decarboxylase-like enzyme
MTEKYYGPHLTLNLVGCNPDKVSNGEFVYKFLSDLPAKIGMNKIGNPHLDLYTGEFSEWGGFSATIHIQTSHITFHFFEWGYCFGDIFSCKDFDVANTIKLIMDELEADKHEPRFQNSESKMCLDAAEFLKDKKSTWNLYQRGFNFPPSIS